MQDEASPCVIRSHGCLASVLHVVMIVWLLCMLCAVQDEASAHGKPPYLASHGSMVQDARMPSGILKTGRVAPAPPPKAPSPEPRKSPVDSEQQTPQGTTTTQGTAASPADQSMSQQEAGMGSGTGLVGADGQQGVNQGPVASAAPALLPPDAASAEVASTSQPHNASTPGAVAPTQPAPAGIAGLRAGQSAQPGADSGALSASGKLRDTRSAWDTGMGQKPDPKTGRSQTVSNPGPVAESTRPSPRGTAETQNTPTIPAEGPFASLPGQIGAGQAPVTAPHIQQGPGASVFSHAPGTNVGMGRGGSLAPAPSAPMPVPGAPRVAPPMYRGGSLPPGLPPILDAASHANSETGYKSETNSLVFRRDSADGDETGSMVSDCTHMHACTHMRACMHTHACMYAHCMHGRSRLLMHMHVCLGTCPPLSSLIHPKLSF